MFLGLDSGSNMGMPSRKKRKRTADSQAEIDFRRAEKRQRVSQAHEGEKVRFMAPGPSRTYTNDEKVGPNCAESKYQALSQKSKTVLLAERCAEIFGISTVQGVCRLERVPSALNIRSLAEDVAQLWPKDWRDDQTIVERNEGFKVLLWANQTPSVVANSLTRASLYANKIYVCNPFTTIMLFHPQQSPLVRPDMWLYDFAQSAAFMALVKPWVECGIVELVQNPLSFDVNLFPRFRQAAEDRIKREPRLLELIESSVHDQSMLGELLLQFPRSDWERIIRSFPLDDEEQNDALRHATALAEDDPVRATIPEALGIGGKSQLMSHGNGLTYEQALILASGRDAQIVTSDSHESRVIELDTKQHRTDFQKAAHAFSKLELNFLNNVPADFAINIRKEGRLQGFRSYLSKLSSDIQFRSDEGEFNDNAPYEFMDRFGDEYATYCDEWKDIQRSLATSAGTAALTAVATGAAAFLTGNLTLPTVLATTVTPSFIALSKAISERKKAERQPLGVVMRLERRSQKR